MPRFPAAGAPLSSLIYRSSYISSIAAEKSTYTQKVDFAKLRSELLNSDSTEAQLTRSSHEKIAADLAKLNSRLRDEIGRTQASVRLDLNLEKGRIREEANSQEMRIKETETRIEQEVAGLRERVEAVKFSTLQWLMYALPFFMRSLLERANSLSQGCLYRYCGYNPRCLAPIHVRILYIYTSALPRIWAGVASTHMTSAALRSSLLICINTNSSRFVWDFVQKQI